MGDRSRGELQAELAKKSLSKTLGLGAPAQVSRSSTLYRCLHQCQTADHTQIKVRSTFLTRLPQFDHKPSASVPLDPAIFRREGIVQFFFDHDKGWTREGLKEHLSGDTCGAPDRAKR
jgi:hypothetical protein